MKYRRLRLVPFGEYGSGIFVGTGKNFDLGVFLSTDMGIFGIALGFAYFEVCW